MTKVTLSRRGVLAGAASAAALGVFPAPALAARSRYQETLDMYRKMYRAMPEERFPIAAVDPLSIESELLRNFTQIETRERPGTVIVDTGTRRLYLVLPEGRAVRYGIGVGRAGFEWKGRAVIQYKREWPTWTPPAEMIERQPELEPWRNGMPPGIDNPLGARALYIFRNGRDTLYRLHGTNEPKSIGLAISSGCVRLIQQDVIDLYNRVPDGSPIVVI
ncbi:L,D-transpeptidase [Cucumibacter marinus]|uniref:L,D-transpeptidase n=1 Tax=Cucumibacter marinus TaxID=1121252 RepID=UPI00040223E4|nr:L,D-transpeptidase [Cucumibacter marinus]